MLDVTEGSVVNKSIYAESSLITILPQIPVLGKPIGSIPRDVLLLEPTNQHSVQKLRAFT